jgi:hypothetical protein
VQAATVPPWKLTRRRPSAIIEPAGGVPSIVNLRAYVGDNRRAAGLLPSSSQPAAWGFHRDYLMAMERATLAAGLFLPDAPMRPRE